MLDRAYEWYRLVEPAPSDDTIAKRRAAVSDLVQRLAKEKTFDLLIAVASGTVAGFDQRAIPSARVVQELVGAIRKHQPAFPADLADNALALRACGALTLGELLHRSKNDDEDGLLAASLLVAALGQRGAAKERYLRQMLLELGGLALTVLERQATVRRERTPQAMQSLEGLTPPTEVAAFWGQLLPVLKKVIAELQGQAAADREELQVLWWLYRGCSDAAQERLLALPPGTAALCCGAELANLVVCPPGHGVRAIVQRAAGEGRKKNACGPLKLAEIAAAWDKKVLPLLATDDKALGTLVQENPSLLPLSWLCRRLLDSGAAAGWEDEFATKTGIPADHSGTPGDWACQAFHERVAQRLYLDLKAD